MNNAFDLRMAEYREQIESALFDYLPSENCLQKTVVSAMKYSLSVGGKRIRPILTLEFCRLCGGKVENAMPFACALEMIHTYSLIHDDLPCMDDDAIRRGQPSNHVVFGEWAAVLAGDGLLNLAFETMLAKKNTLMISPEVVIRAAHEVAVASGVEGMVGGQTIDIESEDHEIDRAVLLKLNAGKTGAIIRAAAKAGVIIGGGDTLMLEAADNYARNIGLAFQIVDDILDCTSDTFTLGKPVGSDEKSNKTTYVTLFGKEKAGEIATELTNQAIATARESFKDSEFLTELAGSLLNRKS